MPKMSGTGHELGVFVDGAIESVDTDVVEAFAAAGAEPAFHDRVRSGARTGASGIVAPSERKISSKTRVNFVFRSAFFRISHTVDDATV